MIIPAGRPKSNVPGEITFPLLRSRRVKLGSAAIDLCWCACGRYDAYYERGPKIWDVAAGVLIAERTGLVVRDLPASGEHPAGIVLGPEGLVDELFELVEGGSRSWSSEGHGPSGASGFRPRSRLK